jgi:hypothetical protein
VQPLDYETEAGRPEPPGAALVALPAAAGAVTLAVVGYAVRYDPFFVYRARDAALLIGGPLVVLVLWIAWLITAVRRGRARSGAFTVVLLVAALNVWIVSAFAVVYWHDVGILRR